MKVYKRNPIIELCKYSASIMIVAIHTTRSFGTESAIGFFFINILCRLAVPFFAICSGYFLSNKEESNNDNSEIERRVWTQERKLCKLYLLWSMVYLLYSIPVWIRSGWFSLYAFVDYAIATVKIGSYYHFWYLLSLIYALPLFLLMLESLKRSQLLIISVLLWIGKVLLYAYQGIVFNMGEQLNKVFGIVPGVADAVLCILPLLLLGAYIHEEKKREQSFYLVGYIVSFFGLCIEAFWLRSIGQLSTSYIFFTFPVAYFLFHILISCETIQRKKIADILGGISMVVYCVHPIVGEVTDGIISNSIHHFVVTAALSTILAWIGIQLIRLLRGSKPAETRKS